MKTLFFILIVSALAASAAVAQRADPPASIAASDTSLVPQMALSRAQTYFDSTGHPYKRGLGSATDSLGQTSFFSYSLTQDSLGNWQKQRYHTDTATKPIAR